MTHDLVRARLERVNVMRPDSFPVVFAEVTAAGDAVLAHHLVTDRLHRRTTAVHFRNVPDLDQHVDDGLRVYAGDGRAADVVDSRDVLAQRPGDTLRLRRKRITPTWVVCDDFYLP